MIPRPTTTSAAATTSTNTTTVWPSMSSSMREKVTKVRVTALSISSTHMNITSGLRRTSSPTAPIAKSIDAQHQVPGRRDLGDGDHQALRLGSDSGSARVGRLGAAASSASWAATSGSSIRSARLTLRASTTAPTTAITSRTRGDLEGEQVGREERLAELGRRRARAVVEEVGVARLGRRTGGVAVGGPEREAAGRARTARPTTHGRDPLADARAARSRGPRRGRRRAASARTGTARRWRRRRR